MTQPESQTRSATIRIPPSNTSLQPTPPSFAAISLAVIKWMTVLCVENKDSLDLQAMTNQPSKFAWANQGFR